MDASTREDYLWLLSESAIPWLKKAGDSYRGNGSVVQLAQQLRKDLSSSRAGIVMEQAQLRLRAEPKFPQAESMFFTKRGLEQSSGRGIAIYKAAKFADCENVADVCCGIGGDLIALHRRTDSSASITTGVDADELTASFARHNLQLCCSDSAGHGEVLFQDFESMSVAGLDGMHADPDRRGNAADFRRTVHGSRFEPSLSSLFERTGSLGLVAIKVAPATPASDDWPDSIEREWIGDRQECKQQIIWRGERVVRVGHRTATCVGKLGTAAHFSVSESTAAARLPVADSIGGYIHEPHPAVLAAGLGHALGQVLGLSPLATDVAYLTGAEAEHPLMQSFKVIEVLPLNLKKAAAALRSMDVGSLEVKRRGVEQAIGDQFMKLKLSGSLRATAILTRLDDKRMAIIARRVSGFLGQAAV